ncbi:neutral zinc metallopeptidase [Streptosporangium sp. NPDC051022]|uniref:neutral zinc metallopeptidase n=1 Tax=Streptosporangium sp. NPDC051022 TaxID=3155752 RepID=UPI00341AFC95
MDNPLDRTREEPQFGVVRRTLGYLFAFAFIAAAFYFGGHFEGASGPASGSSVQAAVTQRLYRETGPIDARCDPLPGTLEAESTLNALSLCLDRMWSATLAKAGVPYQQPEIRLVATPAEAACTTDEYDWSGIYCSDLRVINILSEASVLQMMFTLAHEYAHHAQELGGTAGAQWMMEGGEEWSRRFELQADCLAAVTLRTAAPGVLAVTRQLAEDAADAVDDRERAYRRGHGSPVHSAAWIGRGEQGGAMASCDTWEVPAGQVS